MSNAEEPEQILEPARAIIDAHHHLWHIDADDALIERLRSSDRPLARAQSIVFRLHSRFLFDEMLEAASSGHNIVSTVYLEAHAMYRADGPDAMKSLGEVEFANGVAAMGASGRYGPLRPCAGIVGNVDLRLGDAVEDVLAAHLQAAPDRYRGVRCGVLTVYDEDASIITGGVPDIFSSSDFRAGLTVLQRLGLSFDVFILEPQIPQLIDVAQAFPDLPIILDHLGGIVGIGRHAGGGGERFAAWRANMRRLAECGNVVVKLGGLGMAFAGLPSFAATPRAGSARLAEEWWPYIETAIEIFGSSRCMFESNYPVDAATCSYATLWNSFKRITRNASEQEKTDLFSATAARTYRLPS